MALHLMEISGKLANVVFYKKNGKNFARIAPAEFERTAPMKARSQNFGLASRNGRILRRMLAGLLPFPKDKSMQSRFSGIISRWMGKREVKDIAAEKNIVYLSDFQFNDKYWLTQRLRIGLTVSQPSDNMLQLNIPAFVPTGSIIAPEGTVSVNLQVCAAPVNLAEGTPDMEFSTNIEIAYNADSRAAQTIELPMKTKSGTLIVTTCALSYTVLEDGKNVISKTAAFMVAGVVDARYC
jgi:hypothetical protein